MLDKIIERKRVFSDILDRTRRNQMCWRSITMRYEKKMKFFSKKGYGLFSQCFPVWGWFSRALTFLSLYYPLGKMGTISGLKPGSMFGLLLFFPLFWFVLFCLFIQCVLVRLPWLQLFAHLEQKLIKGSCNPARWISMRPMMNNLII